MKVKIIILLIIVSLLMFTSCGNTEEEKVILNSDIWKEIVNKEWLAGLRGLYFYEKDNLHICIYMEYGSGVPLIDLHESEVEIIDKKIIFEILSANGLSKKNDIIKVHFTYKDGKLIYNYMIYEEVLFRDTDFIIKIIEEYKEYLKDD